MKQLLFIFLLFIPSVCSGAFTWNGATVSGINGATVSGWNGLTLGGGSGPVCTGSETFIRGASASGDTESFEKGSAEFCATDLTTYQATGVDSYSTGWANSGTHSLALTDSSSTSAPSVYADHGSNQTAQYYRFYMEVPDVASYGTFSMFGLAKYATGATSVIQVYDPTGGAGGEVLRFSGGSETIAVTVGETVRVELYANDSDGSGATKATLIAKVWDQNGDPIETSNGGGDYEISLEFGYDAYRYMFLEAANSSATSNTVYLDDVKNCNTWCGAE